MTQSTQANRFTQAYHHMMERMKLHLDEFEQAEKAAFPRLNASIEHAVEKAVELGELTREEAQLIGGYLQRDLEDAGQYLITTGRDLGAWLRFDLQLLEDRLADFLRHGVDQSRMDLLALASSLPAEAETEVYRSGEVTGPGTLQCETCGKSVVFHAPRLIQPCARCGADLFLRVYEVP